MTIAWRTAAVSLGGLALRAYASESAGVADAGPTGVKIGTTQQFDYAAYRSAVGDWPDTHYWRRGRLNVVLGLGEHWEARLEYDFAAHPGYTDAYVGYADHRQNVLILGQTKQPFGLDASSGDRNGVFMERGLSFAFAPRRAPGIMLQTYRPHWTAGAGVFGTPLSQVQVGDEGVAAAARVTFAPVRMATQVVHLGLGLAWREPPSENSSNAVGAKFSTVRFRSRPESDGAAHNLVDSGEIHNVSSYQLVGLEVGSQAGALALQAEYQWLQVGRNGASSAQFSGWYVQLAYSLTGEVRPYRTDRGTFESVVPARALGRGGYGAFEVAARISAVNLNDAGVGGGRATDAAIALNWYLNAQWRIGANLIKVLQVCGGPVSGQEPTVWQLRAQLAR